MKHLTKLPIFIYQFTATEEEIDFTWICALSSLNSIRKHNNINNNNTIRYGKPNRTEKFIPSLQWGKIVNVKITNMQCTWPDNDEIETLVCVCISYRYRYITHIDSFAIVNLLIQSNEQHAHHEKQQSTAQHTKKTSSTSNHNSSSDKEAVGFVHCMKKKNSIRLRFLQINCVLLCVHCTHYST